MTHWAHNTCFIFCFLSTLFLLFLYEYIILTTDKPYTEFDLKYMGFPKSLGTRIPHQLAVLVSLDPPVNFQTSLNFQFIRQEHL